MRQPATRLYRRLAGPALVSVAFAAASPLAAAAGDAAPPASASDFARRCALPGVIRCIGFDDDADFNAGRRGTSGAYGANSGILPPSGTSDYTRATRDTTVRASGSASLKFTIPSNTGADTSGSFFANFSKDLSVQFDGGQSFYVQWRQRFSPEFLSTVYRGGGGWKQIIIGAGDRPGRVSPSCSPLEVVVQNIFGRGFPQMYNSCTGSSSHGPYAPFQEPFQGSDFKLQNRRPQPYCLYSQGKTSYFPPVGNCAGYVPDEWMTFQVGIELGPREGDEFKKSRVTLWMAREGHPSELIFQWGPYNLSAGNPADGERFGKVWLLPYNTGKSAEQAHPTAYTWYDELIIATHRIDDPK